ncbi:MAG: hypothetical protein ACREBR_04380 [bacterium]
MTYYEKHREEVLIRQKQNRLNETVEQRALRLAKKLEYNRLHNNTIAIKRKLVRDTESPEIHEKRLAKVREWKKLHKTELAQKIVARLHVDHNFRIAKNLRTRLRKALKFSWKSGSAVDDLGCSIDFLRQYLSTKFDGNMSWNNYGTYWEIDHIAPLSNFDLTDRNQFLKAVRYTNLQPLTIPNNRSKGVN